MVPERVRIAVITAVGGGIGIGIMGALASLAHMPVMVVPFATSIVLVMGAPDSPQAQPRNIVGGHILSGLAGLLVLAAFGSSLWVAALGVALAILAMQLAKCFHPPAGISPVLIVTGHFAVSYLIVPVLAGALILTFYAWLYHRLTSAKPWPERWF